jgi:hypothetical protein
MHTDNGAWRDNNDAFDTTYTLSQKHHSTYLRPSLESTVTTPPAVLSDMQD